VGLKFRYRPVLSPEAGMNLTRLIFLRDYLGIDRLTRLYFFRTHHQSGDGDAYYFSLVFAIGYCVVAEVFPKVKLWQGAWAGIVATIAVHWISFPLLGLTPSLLNIPADEYISELVGHIFWFWAIEIPSRSAKPHYS
jgi:putative membrane protein